MILEKPGRVAFHDVFLSYAAHDRSVADVVRRKLAEFGLSVFDDSQLAPGENVANAVRRAMRESAALVAIATPTYVDSPNLLVEVGAAWGLRKPVYLLWNEAAVSRIPDHLKKFRVWPMAQVEDLARELVSIAQPLPVDQRRILGSVYQRLGVPSDQILRDATASERLTKTFNRASRTQTTEEVLLRELLRMRKQGTLPRLRRK